MTTSTPLKINNENYYISAVAIEISVDGFEAAGATILFLGYIDASDHRMNMDVGSYSENEDLTDLVQMFNTFGSVDCRSKEQVTAENIGDWISRFHARKEHVLKEILAIREKYPSLISMRMTSSELPLDCFGSEAANKILTTGYPWTLIDID